MSAYLTYIKIGAAALLLALTAGAGYHFGGLASKTALEAQHAAQLQAAVTALDAQASQRVAAEAKLAKVQGDYDAIKDVPDPVSVGLAHRVLFSAASSCSDSVPSAPAVASGTPGAAAVALGPSAVERALNHYIEACGADAKQLATVIQLAPR